MTIPIIFCKTMIVLATLWSCQDTETSTTTFLPIEGNTMGTTYHIIYETTASDIDLKPKVDSVLAQLNMAVSTYIPESIISRLNRGENIDTEKEDRDIIDFFKTNINTAKRIFQATDGYFDPTVMPLVNYYGFGYAKRNKVEEIDTAHIADLMKGVGFQKIMSAFDATVWKIPSHVELDLSAIAKGGAVDYLMNYFLSLGFDNFMIEIGGETYGRGGGRAGKGWIIGINTPKEHALATDIFDKVVLKNKAIATSGNYRNFYEVDGHKYAHTINPKTGFFEQKNVISATVLADDCASADALATACVAAGLDQSKEFFKNYSEAEAYLLYNNGSDSLLIYQTAAMDTYKFN
ncbi:FAD:protein FMN transferase [Membranihabitans marinus]